MQWENIVFGIDAACVMPELKSVILDGEDGFEISDANSEYKYAVMHDGFLLASKDCKDWVIAIYVSVQGKELTGKDFQIAFESIENAENKGEQNG